VGVLQAPAQGLFGGRLLVRTDTIAAAISAQDRLLFDSGVFNGLTAFGHSP